MTSMFEWPTEKAQITQGWEKREAIAILSSMSSIVMYFETIPTITTSRSLSKLARGIQGDQVYFLPKNMLTHHLVLPIISNYWNLQLFSNLLHVSFPWCDGYAPKVSRSGVLLTRILVWFVYFASSTWPFFSYFCTFMHSATLRFSLPLHLT